MKLSMRKAKGELNTPTWWSSLAIADIESPACTLTRTCLPDPPIGKYWSANQTMTTTNNATRTASALRSGLTSISGVRIILQKNHRCGRVDALAVILGLYPGLKQRALGLECREA